MKWVLVKIKMMIVYELNWFLMGIWYMKFSYKYSNKWVIPPYNYDSIYFPAENKHMLKIKIMSFPITLVS